jgi:hypothetical protein
VREGALTALASVADSAQELFQTYYDAVMPLLFQILTQCNERPQRLLRAKVRQGVGWAVGASGAITDGKGRRRLTMPHEHDSLPLTLGELCAASTCRTPCGTCLAPGAFLA